MDINKWNRYYSWWVFLFFIAYKLKWHNWSPGITYLCILLCRLYIVWLFIRKNDFRISNYKVALVQFITMVLLDIVPMFFVSWDFSPETLLVNLVLFMFYLDFTKITSINELLTIYTKPLASTIPGITLCKYLNETF